MKQHTPEEFSTRLIHWGSLRAALAQSLVQRRLRSLETVTDAIERHRRRVRELRADLHRIESAPFPSSHAKQRMRAQIEALAMQGAPSVSSLIEHDGKIEFQTQRLTSEVHAERRSLAFTEVSDGRIGRMAAQRCADQAARRRD